jgi:hypothetical protein
MKIFLDGCSITAVGGWNAQIFSLNWLQKNVCDNSECEVQVAVPLNNPSAQTRLSFEGVHLFVNPSRLDLKPQNYELESFKKCAKFLKKILSILNHTPVASFGVNFTFVSDGDHGEIQDKFIFPDIARFDADDNKLQKTSINRAFEQQDSSILNLSVTLEAEKVVVSFNYHKDVDDAGMCAEQLVDGMIEKYHKNSLDILSKVYDVQVTEDQETEV